MAADSELAVEVAYARPDAQWLLPLRLPRGTTAAESLIASRLLEQCPELQIGEPLLGVWSRPVTTDTVLEDGDRLEIYRPLTADPKTARRRRADARPRRGFRPPRPPSPSEESP